MVRDDLITQEIWEVPASAPAIFSFDTATNEWVMTGDNSYQSLALINGTTQPVLMLIGGNVSEIDGDGLAYAANGGGAIRTTGNYKVVFDKNVQNFQGYKRSAGYVNARIGKPYFREIIEVI